MALIRVKVQRLSTWSPTDRLRLYIGTENAASLAASTPAGGTMVMDVPAFDGPSGSEKGGLGFEQLDQAIDVEGAPAVDAGELDREELDVLALPRKVIEYRYFPGNRSATLPIGVKRADAAGNESAVVETVVQLADTPRAPRNVVAHATVNAGEVRLTWTQSPDVV
jgi:hypothetical protein